MSDCGNDDVLVALKAIETGDTTMPPEFFPNECYFPSRTVMKMSVCYA